LPVRDRDRKLNTTGKIMKTAVSFPVSMNLFSSLFRVMVQINFHHKGFDDFKAFARLLFSATSDIDVFVLRCSKSLFRLLRKHGLRVIRR
jgi:hypothetical protein